MSPTRWETCLNFLGTHCFVIFLILFILPPFVYPISFSKTYFDAGDLDILYEGDGKSSSISIELNLVGTPFRVGRAIYAESLHLWDSSTGILTDFTTSFSFTVATRGSDGFAFFLAPVGYKIPPNSAAENLGLFNITSRRGLPNNQIIFIEFDTMVNPEIDPPPPVKKHIGINNNSISSLAYASWNLEYNITQEVLIAYNSTTKDLVVVLSNESNSGSISLSHNINLMEALPEWITIGFSASTGNLALGLSFGFLYVKKKRSKNIDSHGNDLERETFPRRFHYQELVVATNSFANDRRLGQGGSGQVYKGILIDLCRLVAVKRIIAKSENSDRTFINEAKIISRLIHRNLVQFIGWCNEEDEILLVHEFMPNGSLDTHLFGNRRTLQWNLRYKIALGLASAMHYLHEDAEQCVIHRDIKSANVLLGRDFSTKLGDFGVAKLVDPLLRTQMNGVVGTYGYLAPEYFNHGKASKESDMYSFGVVALEIVCGRRTYLDNEGDHVPLLKWVWELYVAGDILNAADERLKMEFDESEMRCLLIVGLWCTHPNDRKRPKAGQVIKVLQLGAPLPELPHDMHENVVHPTHGGQANSIQSQPITSSLEKGGR
ncbi:Lectin receptor kinase [Quillaja saponaria]|uniref:Lectin receptor kinase n=1 Tax=Quillaja saponaria TaxID=32244 RepID=A0AAD7PKH6_QUISA|nr:Lectin receptor kinase [Quillaja saponaria]